ncbi:unnamed protein product, partial [Owenia fusiformis]
MAILTTATLAQIVLLYYTISTQADKHTLTWKESKKYVEAQDNDTSDFSNIPAVQSIVLEDDILNTTGPYLNQYQDDKTHGVKKNDIGSKYDGSYTEKRLYSGTAIVKYEDGAKIEDESDQLVNRGTIGEDEQKRKDDLKQATVQDTFNETKEKDGKESFANSDDEIDASAPGLGLTDANLIATDENTSDEKLNTLNIPQGILKKSGVNNNLIPDKTTHFEVESKFASNKINSCDINRLVDTNGISLNELISDTEIEPEMSNKPNVHKDGTSDLVDEIFDLVSSSQAPGSEKPSSDTKSSFSTRNAYPTVQTDEFNRTVTPTETSDKECNTKHTKGRDIDSTLNSSTFSSTLQNTSIIGHTENTDVSLNSEEISHSTESRKLDFEYNTLLRKTHSGITGTGDVHLTDDFPNTVQSVVKGSDENTGDVKDTLIKTTTTTVLPDCTTKAKVNTPTGDPEIVSVNLDQKPVGDIALDKTDAIKPHEYVREVCTHGDVAVVDQLDTNKNENDPIKCQHPQQRESPTSIAEPSKDDLNTNVAAKESDTKLTSHKLINFTEDSDTIRTQTPDDEINNSETIESNSETATELIIYSSDTETKPVQQRIVSEPNNLAEKYHKYHDDDELCVCERITYDNTEDVADYTPNFVNPDFVDPVEEFSDQLKSLGKESTRIISSISNYFHQPSQSDEPPLDEPVSDNGIDIPRVKSNQDTNYAAYLSSSPGSVDSFVTAKSTDSNFHFDEPNIEEDTSFHEEDGVGISNTFRDCPYLEHRDNSESETSTIEPDDDQSVVQSENSKRTERDSTGDTLFIEFLKDQTSQRDILKPEYKESKTKETNSDKSYDKGRLLSEAVGHWTNLKSQESPHLPRRDNLSRKPDRASKISKSIHDNVNTGSHHSAEELSSENATNVPTSCEQLSESITSVTEVSTTETTSKTSDVNDDNQLDGDTQNDFDPVSLDFDIVDRYFDQYKSPRSNTLETESEISSRQKGLDRIEAELNINDSKDYSDDNLALGNNDLYTGYLANDKTRKSPELSRNTSIHDHLLNGQQFDATDITTLLSYQHGGFNVDNSEKQHDGKSVNTGISEAYQEDYTLLKSNLDNPEVLTLPDKYAENTHLTPTSPKSGIFGNYFTSKKSRTLFVSEEHDNQNSVDTGIAVKETVDTKIEPLDDPNDEPPSYPPPPIPVDIDPSCSIETNINEESPYPEAINSLKEHELLESNITSVYEYTTYEPEVQITEEIISKQRVNTPLDIENHSIPVTQHREPSPPPIPKTPYPDTDTHETSKTDNLEKPATVVLALFDPSNTEEPVHSKVTPPSVSATSHPDSLAPNAKEIISTYTSTDENLENTPGETAPPPIPETPYPDFSEESFTENTEQNEIKPTNIQSPSDLNETYENTYAALDINDVESLEEECVDGSDIEDDHNTSADITIVADDKDLETNEYIQIIPDAETVETVTVSDKDVIKTDKCQDLVINSDPESEEYIEILPDSKIVEEIEISDEQVIKTDTSQDIASNIEPEVEEYIEILPDSEIVEEVEISGEKVSKTDTNQYCGNNSPEDDQIAYINKVEPCCITDEIVVDHRIIQHTDNKLIDAGKLNEPTISTTGNNELVETSSASTKGINVAVDPIIKDDDREPLNDDEKETPPVGVTGYQPSVNEINSFGFESEDSEKPVDIQAENSLDKEIPTSDNELLNYGDKHAIDNKPTNDIIRKATNEVVVVSADEFIDTDSEADYLELIEDVREVVTEERTFSEEPQKIGPYSLEYLNGTLDENQEYEELHITPPVKRKVIKDVVTTKSATSNETIGKQIEFSISPVKTDLIRTEDCSTIEQVLTAKTSRSNSVSDNIGESDTPCKLGEVTALEKSIKPKDSSQNVGIDVTQLNGDINVKGDTRISKIKDSSSIGDDTDIFKISHSNTSPHSAFTIYYPRQENNTTVYSAVPYIAYSNQERRIRAPSTTFSDISIVSVGEIHVETMVYGRGQEEELRGQAEVAMPISVVKQQGPASRKLQQIKNSRISQQHVSRSSPDGTAVLEVERNRSQPLGEESKTQVNSHGVYTIKSGDYKGNNRVKRQLYEVDAGSLRSPDSKRVLGSSDDLRYNSLSPTSVEVRRLTSYDSRDSINSRDSDTLNYSMDSLDSASAYARPLQNKGAPQSIQILPQQPMINKQNNVTHSVPSINISSVTSPVQFTKDLTLSTNSPSRPGEVRINTGPSTYEQSPKRILLHTPVPQSPQPNEYRVSSSQSHHHNPIIDLRSTPASMTENYTVYRKDVTSAPTFNIHSNMAQNPSSMAREQQNVIRIPVDVAPDQTFRQSMGTPGIRASTPIRNTQNLTVPNPGGFTTSEKRTINIPVDVGPQQVNQQSFGITPLPQNTPTLRVGTSTRPRSRSADTILDVTEKRYRSGTPVASSNVSEVIHSAGGPISIKQPIGSQYEYDEYGNYIDVTEKRTLVGSPIASNNIAQITHTQKTPTSTPQHVTSLFTETNRNVIERSPTPLIKTTERKTVHIPVNVGPELTNQVSSSVVLTPNTRDINSNEVHKTLFVDVQGNSSPTINVSGIHKNKVDGDDQSYISKVFIPPDTTESPITPSRIDVNVNKFNQRRENKSIVNISTPVEASNKIHRLQINSPAPKEIHRIEVEIPKDIEEKETIHRLRIEQEKHDPHHHIIIEQPRKEEKKEYIEVREIKEQVPKARNKTVKKVTQIVEKRPPTPQKRTEKREKIVEKVVHIHKPAKVNEEVHRQEVVSTIKKPRVEEHQATIKVAGNSKMEAQGEVISRDPMFFANEEDEEFYEETEVVIPPNDNFNVNRGRILITNHLDTTGPAKTVDIVSDNESLHEYIEENVNMFNDEFKVTRENPVYYSDDETLNETKRKRTSKKTIEKVTNINVQLPHTDTRKREEVLYYDESDYPQKKQTMRIEEEAWQRGGGDRYEDTEEIEEREETRYNVEGLVEHDPGQTRYEYHWKRQAPKEARHYK